MVSEIAMFAASTHWNLSPTNPIQPRSHPAHLCDMSTKLHGQICGALTWGHLAESFLLNLPLWFSFSCSLFCGIILVAIILCVYTRVTHLFPLFLVLLTLSFGFLPFFLFILINIICIYLHIIYTNKYIYILTYYMCVCESAQHVFTMHILSRSSGACLWMNSVLLRCCVVYHLWLKVRSGVVFSSASKSWPWLSKAVWLVWFFRMIL